jgi:hypothetical protein
MPGLGVSGGRGRFRRRRGFGQLIANEESRLGGQFWGELDAGADKPAERNTPRVRALKAFVQCL